MTSGRSRFRLIIASVSLLAITHAAHGWILNGYRWTAAETTLHLQLHRAAASFQDGSTSWNHAAGDAIRIWNSHLDELQLLEGSSTSAASPGDGFNQVFFSSTVYGDNFPTSVLAVTLNYSTAGSGTFTETDVVFNDSLKWDSYRGPLQRHPSGETIFDLHRVALHEIGHVLGLHHPDEHGQRVVAIMNSIIGDLDAVSDDDIAGVQSLYGFRITSSANPPAVRVGKPFSYQITANRQPSSYAAAALPPGLQIDANTGLISGTPTIDGTFATTVSAVRAGKTASAVVQIVVAPIPESEFAITSSSTPPIAYLGQPFAFQITTTHRADSFGATALPPGLQLDSATGLISGTPTAMGSYAISLTATRAGRITPAVVRILVNTPGVETTLVRSFQIAVGRVVADAARRRIYATDWRAGSVAIIDVESLSIIKMIQVGNMPYGLAISADGSRLWVANRGSTAEAIGVIDLNTLERLPSIALPRVPSDVIEGRDNRLYLSPGNDFEGVMQVDAATGTFQGNLAGVLKAVDMDLEVSPDRNTLYMSAGTYPSHVERVDISGPVATLIQRRSLSSDSSRVAVSHDGTLVVHSPWEGHKASEGQRSIFVMAADDLERQEGVISSNGYNSRFGLAEFSGDDAVLYLTESQVGTQATIGLYDTQSFTRLGTFDLGGTGDRNPSPLLNVTDMVVDPAGAYLFVANSYFGSNGELRVYKTGRLNGPPVATSQRLANLSTRLHARGGEQSLIGGFIVTGNTEKKVLLRAVGPSLPIQGHLANPTLELRDSTGRLLAANDDWSADAAAIAATTLPPSHHAESAIVRNLLPGSYTATVGSADGKPGIALVEVYDLEPNRDAGVVNISTRGEVGGEEAVMIGGVILRGDHPTKIVVRAIGPSLSAAGVTNAVADPVLEVFDGNGDIVAANADWRADQEDDLIATGIAPTDDREAAAVMTLGPGNYTTVVRGANQTTGIALVEIYNLEQN